MSPGHSLAEASGAFTTCTEMFIGSSVVNDVPSHKKAHLPWRRLGASLGHRRRADPTVARVRRQDLSSDPLCQIPYMWDCKT
jgi:hypothetical protein